MNPNAEPADNDLAAAEPPSEASADDDSHAAVKPARRKRATKAAAPDEAAGERVALDGERAPTPSADDPGTPARRRRRTGAAAATDDSEAAPAVGNGADVTAAPTDGSSSAAEPSAESAPAAEEAAPRVGAAAAGEAVGPAEEPTGAVPAPGSDEGSDADAPRSGRPRRRRSGRGAAHASTDEAGVDAAPAAGAADQDGADDGDDDTAEQSSAGVRPFEDETPAQRGVAVVVDAQAALALAGDLFGEVLSGAFDVEAEPTVAEPAAPHKRVLLPEPEAPKLHKVLAQAGIGSRRDMEQLIVDGQITVNGKPAHTGQRISFGDQIAVRGKPVRVRIVPPPPRIIAYHKPAGEVVTNDDPQHRPTVFRRLPRLQQGKWQAVGRLDLNTEGLLLFTSSGELANQLMHPRFGVEREYAVRVLGTLDAEDKAMLLEGVQIEGQTAAFRSIEDGGGEGANRWYRVVIAEGRNREVRKLFAAVDLTVSRLIRIRYGSVVLPRGLRRGVWVDLEDADVRTIRRLAGGPSAEPRPMQGQPMPRGKNRGRDGGRNEPAAPYAGDRGHRDARPASRPMHAEGAPAAERRPLPERVVDHGMEDDFDPSRIPNPLEQTFDKRFVQNPRSPAGGRGFGRGGGGFGAGGSAPPAAPPQRGGPKEPDPLQTSVGYIGADAFHRKSRGGPGGGSGGGQRGGGGGGRGGFGGGSGGQGGSGGGRRGR